MKVIDEKVSWMFGAKVYPKGVAFEADETMLAQIKDSDSLYEVKDAPAPTEPEPAPDPVDPSSGDEDAQVEESKEEPKADAETEESHEDDEAEAPPEHNLTARYVQGGWYELSNGEKLRRKDLPVGTVIQ